MRAQLYPDLFSRRMILSQRRIRQLSSRLTASQNPAGSCATAAEADSASLSSSRSSHYFHRVRTRFFREDRHLAVPPTHPP
jgi:hypothetical protein